MTECARCGDCCEVIPFDLGRVHKNDGGQLWKYVDCPDPRDDDVWKTEWGGWTDDGRPEAVRNWLDANFIRKHWISIGDGDCTCDMFNSESRLCMAHESRPPVCSDYPWYGKEPAGLLISSRCSFWRDLPRELWEDGVEPL